MDMTMDSRVSSNVHHSSLLKYGPCTCKDGTTEWAKLELVENSQLVATRLWRYCVCSGAAVHALMTILMCGNCLFR
jgi:hypothetical protein